VKLEEWDDRWAHPSTGCGEGRRRSEVGVLSCDGGGNRVGRHRLTGLLGLGKSGPARKVWASWAKIQGEFYNRFVFLISKDF
jgi:hypothetical protein